MYDPEKECKAMIAAIKKICVQKNMTPHALAKEAGISTSTMSYLVNGKTKPQVYTVLLLCNVLGVTISELFDNKVVISTANPVSTDFPESGLFFLTFEEKKLLDCYRDLSNPKRDLLKIYMNMLYQYNDELFNKWDEKIDGWVQWIEWQKTW